MLEKGLRERRLKPAKKIHAGKVAQSLIINWNLRNVPMPRASLSSISLDSGRDKKKNVKEGRLHTTTSKGFKMKYLKPKRDHLKGRQSGKQSKRGGEGVPII